MSVYRPPFGEQDRVIKAALHVVQATHYARESDPHADAEHTYSQEQLALAARELAEAVDRKPADEQPIGWTKDRERPTVVVICGSTRFMEEMAAAAVAETLAGRIVVKPEVNTRNDDDPWSDPDEAERRTVMLHDLHRAKIRLAGEVLVVNPGGYVGESTRAEIAYARELGLPVRYTHPAGPGGHRCDNCEGVAPASCLMNPERTA